MGFVVFDGKVCPECGGELRYQYTGIWCDSYYDCYKCPSGHKWLDFCWLGEHKLEPVPEVIGVEGGEG